MNAKKPTLRHIITKMSKVKDREYLKQQEKKGVTEDEMAGWHHQLNGCESDQTLGDGEGQGSLACCSPRDHRVRHD